MLTWGLCGPSVPIHGPGTVTKSGMLRGIITEKLSTAAREILAVVERTIADYEEEASSFRREIDRQRRQLELLQPEVKTEASGIEDCRSLKLYSHSTNQEEEELKGEDEVERMDYEMPSRDVPPAPPSGTDKFHNGGKKRSWPTPAETNGHVDLKIHILENPTVTTLSPNAFSESPVHDLRVPRGLQEADFLDLLRSAFPQLGGGDPLEVLANCRRRTLEPLNLESLTPEEVAMAAGSSALYIRLKKERGDDEDVADEHSPPEDSPSDLDQ
ncbi:uncharacterized protein KZ484_011515 [Pholidichthys leucotaenia]